MRHLQPPRSKPAMTDKVPRSGAQPGARSPSAPSSRWFFGCTYDHSWHHFMPVQTSWRKIQLVRLVQYVVRFDCKGSQRKQLLVSLASVLCSFLATRSERTLQKPYRLRATSAEALTRLSQTLRMRRRRSSPKHLPVRMDEVPPK